jgi:hypothetical protein
LVWSAEIPFLCLLRLFAAKRYYSGSDFLAAKRRKKRKNDPLNPSLWIVGSESGNHFLRLLRLIAANNPGLGSSARLTLGATITEENPESFTSGNFSGILAAKRRRRRKGDGDENSQRNIPAV